jgi:serine/threonine protein phosphatase PrpC
MRHVLTNVVGARDQVNVHISEFPLVEGDAYLLCSDGLYEPLGDDGIKQILSDGSDPSRAAAGLVREALEKGSRDNVTALVVRAGGAP